MVGIITLQPDGETVLLGPVVDQAALHGLVNRIRDLGVPLVSVKRLWRDQSKRRVNCEHIDSDVV